MRIAPEPHVREPSIQARDLEKDKFTEAQLVAVLREVPRGTLLLCGLAVASLLLAWIAVYVFLFMARGFIA